METSIINLRINNSKCIRTIMVIEYERDYKKIQRKEKVYETNILLLKAFQKFLNFVKSSGLENRRPCFLCNILFFLFLRRASCKYS